MFSVLYQKILFNTMLKVDSSVKVLLSFCTVGPALPVHLVIDAAMRYTVSRDFFFIGESLYGDTALRFRRPGAGAGVVL